MRLFENGVGRPSNEIKKKRRTFIVSIATLCAMMIITLSFILTNINTKKLKGYIYMPTGMPFLKLKSSRLSVSSTCDLLVELNLDDNTKAGINVTQLDILNEDSGYFFRFSDPYESKITNNRYIEKKYKFDKATVEKALKQSKDGKTLTLVLNYDYYQNGEKYNPDNFVFQKKVSNEMLNQIKACKKTTLRKINLSCPKESSLNKEFSCTLNGHLDDLVDTRVWVTNPDGLSPGYKEDFIPEVLGPNSRNMYATINVKFTDKLFTEYASFIKFDSDGYEYIDTQIMAFKNKYEYQSANKTVRIYKESNRPSNARKNVSLTCDTTSEINKEFSCKTNVKNVMITAGGAKSLAYGYPSEFKSSILDKKFELKYDSKLFTDYKSQIKKDSKGEYINAKVTATAKGYKSTTKYVKIYNTKKVTTTTKKTTGTISLSCPASAKINEAFKCKVNQTGVTITLGGANSLASGYSSKFTTTSSDKTKSIKYTNALFTNYKSIIKKDSNGKEYINAQVTAKKSGYKTVTKNVKIYRDTSSGAAAKPITPGAAEAIKTTTVKKTNTTVDKYNLAGIWFSYELSGSGKKKTIKIKPTKYGSNVRNDAYVMCETYSDCINGNAWTNMNNKYKGTQNPTTNRNVARVNKTETLWINTSYNGIANRKYYLRVTTYSNDNASNWLYIGVFEIVVDSKGNVKTNNVSNNFR